MLYNEVFKRGLLIIGASGHGRVAADIAKKMGKWNEMAFIDDNSNIKSTMGLDIVGTTGDVPKYIKEYDVFVAIGNNSIRERFQTQLKIKGIKVPTLIHPSAIFGEQVEIGEGTVIMAGAVINCYTKIGAGCIINTGATVDHDNFIEDFVHLSPGVHTAGNVKIGSRSWFGIGSIAINNITITHDCTIGAGSVVVKPIDVSGTYIGVPARRISK